MDDAEFNARMTAGYEQAKANQSAPSDEVFDRLIGEIFLLPKLSQMNDPMRLLPRGCAPPFCRSFSHLFHKAIIKGSVDRVNGVGVNVKKHGTNDKSKATAFRGVFIKQ